LKQGFTSSRKRATPRNVASVERLPNVLELAPDWNDAVERHDEIGHSARSGVDKFTVDSMT
jgi:hypothetical protein